SRTRRTISLCPLRDSAGEPTGCERICGMSLGILILVTAPHDLTFLSLSLLRLKVERYEGLCFLLLILKLSHNVAIQMRLIIGAAIAVIIIIIVVSVVKA
ncbi:unnamed protein product, partial [Mycena citricolor]